MDEKGEPKVGVWTKPDGTKATEIDFGDQTVKFQKELTTKEVKQQIKEFTCSTKEKKPVVKPVAEPREKMKRGAHLKPFWDYRKAGGKLSLKEYQELVKAGKRPSP